MNLTPATCHLLILLAAYLLGSIPFGLLLTRAVGMGDIRKEGSGNIGATNVARVGGKKLGIAVLLLDMGKGALAVWVAMQFFSDSDVVLALYTVVLGHVFPVWLKFKGGKGVATAFGALIMLHWSLGAGFAATWLIVFALTRYVSLASMLAVAGTIILQVVLYDNHAVAFLSPLFLLILFTHRSNIKRLLNGTEHRFGRTKS